MSLRAIENVAARYIPKQGSGIDTPAFVTLQRRGSSRWSRVAWQNRQRIDWGRVVAARLHYLEVDDTVCAVPVDLR